MAQNEGWRFGDSESEDGLLALWGLTSVCTSILLGSKKNLLIQMGIASVVGEGKSNVLGILRIAVGAVVIREGVRLGAALICLWTYYSGAKEH